MILIDIINFSKPLTQTEREVLQHVNNYIANVIEIEIDILQMQGASYWDLCLVFPESYALEGQEKCLKVLYSLHSIVTSDVIRTELSNKNKYVLYYILQEWINLAKEENRLLINKIPEGLKNRIENELYANESYDKEDKDFFMQCIEDVSEYPELIVGGDLDFLDADLFAEIAIHNPGGLEYLGVDYENIDGYIEVMSLDIKEHYLDICNKNGMIENVEMCFLRILSNTLKKYQKRVISHQKKGEVEITADLMDQMEQALNMNNIFVSRESTMGRAKKAIGETDLYFYYLHEGVTVELALLENKEIGRFKESYKQLMGYLNYTFCFGVTLSINRILSIEAAEEIIKKQLSTIEGDFEPAFIGVDRVDGFEYLFSEHIIPELKTKRMRVYHFIINLNDGSRLKAAIEARR